MRLINKNSRRGIVNLFADFILSKIKKTEKSIIQVTDCGAFMIVNGLTTSNEYLISLILSLSFRIVENPRCLYLLITSMGSLVPAKYL